MQLWKDTGFGHIRGSHCDFQSQREDVTEAFGSFKTETQYTLCDTVNAYSYYVQVTY